ncbi:hypothetical protein BV22DRAFT_660256 [Leucogyrophana mollusca]|uniref:Uncharacterized protein n=1 Tax=Leucogyrophana mollusca TaxID=85980 RepID=A0ACB8B9Q5_9AGAM|nr:hypothetical protein BV22DRAFT_660256 [Leucogyrophana mollusca]
MLSCSPCASCSARVAWLRGSTCTPLGSICAWSSFSSHILHFVVATKSSNQLEAKDTVALQPVARPGFMISEPRQVHSTNDHMEEHWKLSYRPLCSPTRLAVLYKSSLTMY